MHTYCKLLFTNIDIAAQEILIAQLLELEFESFEQTHTTLSAYIPENNFDEQQLQLVIHQPYETVIILPQNWNAQWEKSFDPVIVDDFCCIRASFHPAAPHIKHDIIITPKMSFGTGHHATTWLMVKNIQQSDLSGKKVLDFGTGTGVLAILAEKCGASVIIAIDNDEWSINNAKENLQSNKCEKISLLHADTINLEQKFDVILANINKNVITQQFDSITQHLETAGVLILSGLLQSDYEEIVHLINVAQLELIAVAEKSEWIALTARNRERN